MHHGMNAAPVTTPHLTSTGTAASPTGDAAVLSYPFPAGMELKLQRLLGKRARAHEVLGEYRRFLHLSTLGPVSPSHLVDEAWHLHLTYTQDYWERLPQVLGRALHHNPASSPEDAVRLGGVYLQTLDCYEQLFGAPAPLAIWPDPRRAPLRPRSGRGERGWAGAAIVGTAMLAIALLPPGLVFGLFALAAALGVAHLLRGPAQARAQEGRKASSGSDGAGSSTLMTLGYAADESGSDGGSGDSGGDGGGCGGGCGD
ncbi:hypothetical protein GCM10008955_32730 [Deinococcus malanensis]|uniref:Uncharacterized protein n=1 Tax=Deinococcus malanensis TaxID=1706855 RepID=A0ABQ2F373_9DEIO|nr:hypothetical protein [Deinococcus malanensis]GGK36296.1 hypothetical protein GCM10008955_32730 [Deinococcus malanensis]